MTYEHEMALTLSANIVNIVQFNVGFQTGIVGDISWAPVCYLVECLFKNVMFFYFAWATVRYASIRKGPQA